MAQPVDFVGLNTFIYEPFGWDIEAQADLAGTLDPVEKIRNNNKHNGILYTILNNDNKS